MAKHLRSTTDRDLQCETWGLWCHSSKVSSFAESKTEPSDRVLVFFKRTGLYTI